VINSSWEWPAAIRAQATERASRSASRPTIGSDPATHEVSRALDSPVDRENCRLLTRPPLTWRAGAGRWGT
jgi:hypothetical protein